MCGITGISGPEANSADIKAMCNLIKHRGPDDDGFYTDGGINMGMRRLSIIDLETGKQPMYSNNEQYVITYNGEIYNYKAIRKQLQEKGYKFKTESDTEVIVNAYQEWQYNYVNCLDGMYAIAIWDTKTKTLTLSRDPLGIKPLYYATVNDNVIYGSEIKAILESGLIKPRLDNYSALPTFLTYGSVLGNITMFEGIYKILPGQTMMFRGGNKRQSNIEFKMNPQKISEQEATKKIPQLLEDAVEKRLVADVPVGAFLSGGIDSSAIVSLMSKYKTDGLKTFSVGFNEENDETRFAEEVANEIGTDHHEVTIDENDTPKLTEKLVWHFDDLIGDGAALPTYVVSKEARKHVKVVLSGEGSDEIFAGYNRYKTVSNLFPIPKTSKYKAFYNVISIFNHAQQKQFFNNEGVGAYSALKSYVTGHPLNDMLYFGIREILPNQLLMKADKASMAASLELRVPFLDKELVKYANSLPENLKLNKLNQKYILKKSLHGIVPWHIINRKKHGFDVPLPTWFNGALGEFAAVQLDNGIPKFMKPEPIKKLIAQRKSLTRKDANRLWHILLLKLWMEKFKVIEW